MSIVIIICHQVQGLSVIEDLLDDKEDFEDLDKIKDDLGKTLVNQSILFTTEFGGKAAFSRIYKAAAGA